ncbi:MAG TPA: rhodanese-like domain-containing protein [Zeimonas sp.]|nr:rhodanese-like domain-containing protein [Zeimonas sp.]
MSKFARMAAIAAFVAAPLAALGSPFASLDDVDAARKRGAIVWDARPADEYRRGHIPGAVNIGDPTKVLRGTAREEFLPTWKIETILGAAGIDPSREIVVYGKRGAPQAYFGRFALRYFGADDVKVFHDGVDGWTAAGRELGTTPTSLPPAALRLNPRPEMVVSTEQIVAVGRSGADVQIVDVRSRNEYTGDDVRAIRGGHIPGAINIPYELNWRDPKTPAKLARGQVRDNGGMSLADRESLENLYSALDPFKETIVYCQSGTRSAVTAAVLEDLGFDRVKVYDASWLGYATRLDAPAEQEAFVNVGLLQGQLRALAGRLEQFERRFGAQMSVAEQR